LLALVAGLCLILVGGATLWKSRRPGESRRRRYGRRALLGAVTAIVAIEIGVPIVFAYGYTHHGKSSVPTAHLGVPPEEITFRTSDGLDLAGSYVPSKNGATVIAPAALVRRSTPGC
jgi:hypothetical protein